MVGLLVWLSDALEREGWDDRTAGLVAASVVPAVREFLLSDEVVDRFLTGFYGPPGGAHHEVEVDGYCRSISDALGEEVRRAGGVSGVGCGCPACEEGR
jgi:hypothetical protein